MKIGVKATEVLKLLRHDIELIDSTIRENSTKTHEIFYSQLGDMRSIKEDIETVKADLSRARAERDAKNLDAVVGLERVCDLSEQILERTDKVIEKLQGVVTILQSQDRLDQMLQGSLKVLDAGADSLDGIVSSEDERVALRGELAKNYTISEQRDYANGTASEQKKNKITIF